MTIKKTLEGKTLTLELAGRLDTSTAPDLDRELDEGLAGVSELVLDITELVYLSSAGLRSVLTAQKKMNRQGSMKVRGVRPEIMEVFEMTGFVDILTIV